MLNARIERITRLLHLRDFGGDQTRAAEVWGDDDPDDDYQATYRREAERFLLELMDPEEMPRA